VELFIGRLTRDTHIDDLRGFVRKFDKGGVDIRISEIITPDRRLIRFAYINIPSERLALKAVKKLNLNILCDHPVIVREFSQRRSYNDNRDLNWRDKYWFGSERRSAERRGRLIENRQRRMNAA
jgi:hypothetical protein